MLAEAVSSQIFPLLLLVVAKGRSESNSICMYLCLQSKSCSSVSSPMWVWRQPSLFSVHHKKAQRAVMDTKIAISLLILAFMGNFPEMMLAAELRCHCIRNVRRLMLPKHLANVEIIPKGPHCKAVEIIATLKNGQQICLDPQAKWVKMIINRILHSSAKKQHQ
ncbi:interleukin-8-like [Cygnus atratus]|uniref:interleukin-8-like n=1 Tax=Cygnus atratus TaxID=8868 RepID=UPI0015D59055|nr:interleukin-8-like [Cygnus atratus]